MEKLHKIADNNRHDAGVGVIITNELRNYIHKIHPIHDRLMIMELNFAIPTTIIITYAPTAVASDTTKNAYYQDLNKYTQRYPRKGMIYIYIYIYIY